MEYLIGAAIAIFSYVFLSRFVKGLEVKEDSYSVVYSQSYVYELVKPALDLMPDQSFEINGQSKNYLKNVYMKIMVVNNKAYWIKDNRFIVADIVDGEVNKEGAKEVDTMSMNKVELDEMLFIIEKLREGEDDSRSAG